MNGALDSRVAVVTGGGAGIGGTYVRALHAEGATVAVLDLDGDAAASVAAELGDRAYAFRVDVADEAQVERTMAEVGARFGRLDVLVNNAAVMLAVDKPFKPFWEIDGDEWDRVMGVNAKGAFHACKHAWRLMADSGGGAVVNVTSDAIFHGYAGQLAYFASKGALAVMTRCLARELGEHGIRVNAIAPGLTRSAAVEASEFLESLGPVIRADRALRRDQMPEDLVGTLLYLCTDASRAVTGQTMVVNSGGIMP